MAESDSPITRAPATITVRILRGRNLRGQRGDIVTSQIKLEFGDKSLGETSKVECSPVSPAEFNFPATVTANFDDPHSLEEIANKPVVCTIIEILPKEKKQKEEKTNMLGLCTIDLFPLMLGETKIANTLSLSASIGSPLETIPPDAAKPEIDVEISVEEPLFSESQLKEINLMSVTIESLYSTPDAFQLTGAQFNYTAAMPVPVATDKEMPIVFAGGQLKPGVDKEPPNKQKKWAVPGSATGGAVYIPNKYLSTDISVEDENGDFKAKEDQEHRHLSETEKNRVNWNIERRCYLDGTAAKAMQDKIAKTRWWPVELVRTPATGLGKGGKGKQEDDSTISYHGVVYLNLAPLLYPGIQRIRGAYKVLPFMESELTTKCDRKQSVAEEGVRIANGILNRSGNTPFPKSSKKEDPAKKDKKPAALKLPDGITDAVQEPVNVEGQQYADSKCYMMVEINLSRPLIPRRQPEELAKRVAEYIPPRPMFPKRIDGAQKSVEDFHNQIGVVSNLVLEEFRELFGEKMDRGEMPNTPAAMEERKHDLIYHLNNTGKYFALKEQLKYSVVKIVREKYLKTSNFQDRDELQHFLSELYVFLVDEMHIALSNYLQLEDQAPVPEPLTDSVQLKHFAKEAEINGNFPLAAKYYQERIARDNKDPDHWFDYGTFCMYINDLTKAEECFKECVAIDQRHQQGLMMVGVVNNLREKNEAAETFFEAATSYQPNSILAWTMLGLHYDGIGNEIRAEMAISEANKLNIANAMAVARTQQDNSLADPSVELPDLDPPADAAPDMQKGTPLSMGGSDKTDKAVKLSAKSDRRGSARKSVIVKPKIEGNVADSPLVVKTQNRSASTKSGHLEEDEMVSAQVTREQVLAIPAETIYMQAACFCLEVKALMFAERALAKHLLEPLGGQSCSYYIAMARLNLLQGQMEDAEEALREALQFDHQDPDVWALTGHVKYLVGDIETAKDCYERTAAFVTDAAEMHSIYLRLASIYLQEKQYDKAKMTFLIACKKSPSCLSWLGVGISCYRRGELSEAEDALSEANVLNNTDPEVWAYLALVCLCTGRRLEAEQAYKYSLKLNLEDTELVDEIRAVQSEVGFGDPQF